MCSAMWVHSQNMFWLQFSFCWHVCTIWWIFALQRHLKEQFCFPESLRSSLYGQVFVMLGIELLQRKQSFSFLDKEKQHTLFTFFSDIFVILIVLIILIMLSVLLWCGVPKAGWLENLSLYETQNKNFWAFIIVEKSLVEKCIWRTNTGMLKKEPKVMSKIDAILWHRNEFSPRFSLKTAAY